MSRILRLIILLSIISLAPGCSSPNAIVTQTSAPIKPAYYAVLNALAGN